MKRTFVSAFLKFKRWWLNREKWKLCNSVLIIFKIFYRRVPLQPVYIVGNFIRKCVTKHFTGLLSIVEKIFIFSGKMSSLSEAFLLRKVHFKERDLCKWNNDKINT